MVLQASLKRLLVHFLHCFYFHQHLFITNLQHYQTTVDINQLSYKCTFIGQFLFVLFLLKVRQFKVKLKETF